MNARTPSSSSEGAPNALPRLPGGPTPWLVAAILVFFGLAITSMARKSTTYDEPVYIVGGLSYLSLHDFTMKEDAPPLIGYLSGLSPLLKGVEIPGGKLPFEDSLGHEYPYSQKVLFEKGRDADDILFYSRLAILLPFGLLLLLTVYAFAKSLFGPHAGLLAVGLVALSPNLIAHGRLVAADFPSSATFLFASFLLYRYSELPTRGRAMAAGGAFGLALITKFTCVLLLPLFLVVLPLTLWRKKSFSAKELAIQYAFGLAPAAFIVFFAYGLPPDPVRFLDGLQTIYRNVHTNYPWYLFGEFKVGGYPHYYLAALSVKAAVPLLLLGLTSLFLIRKRSAGWLAELCLFAPAIFLLIAASSDTISAGIRRILPILPVLAISASRWVSQDVRLTRKTWIPIGVLLAWQGLSCGLSWPHYIPYFNEVSGGRSQGPELLDDANIDWGQDLIAVPEVMDEHDLDHVYLCYFGMADPASYGFDHTRIDVRHLAKPAPGVYAVSLHYLIRLRRTGQSWLKRKEPFAKAGTSIWFYRVGG